MEGSLGTDATTHGNGRRAAHERLATGAWAGWARACAAHPRRVLLSWLGIVVVLIALVATVGGGLRDEFEIGSDTQRATDAIEQEFATEQVACSTSCSSPEGERLDTEERKAAIEAAMQELRTDTAFKPTEDKAGLTSVADPFSDQTFADSGRIAVRRRSSTA